MKYSLERSYEILDRTPTVLQALLGGLPDDWVMPNEGPETFSPYDVIGHLIHGERTDWVVRAKLILAFGSTQTFERYDRFAQYEESKGKSLQQLLDEFAAIRKENMGWFKSANLTEEDLDKKGMANTLGNIGQVEFFRGNFQKAIDYTLKGYGFAKEMDYKEWLETG